MRTADSTTEDFIRIWQEVRPVIDDQRWQEVNLRLQRQLKDAREWRDVCLGYFGGLQE